MSTTGTSSTEITGSVRTLDELKNSRNVKKDLGKDEFLQLLMAEMTNQDPMSADSSTEYISQLAQFSALQQMQSLNAGYITSQAYSLLGKYVWVNTEDADGKASTGYGKVSGVVKEDGTDYLVIGDKNFKLSDVVGVVDSESSQTLDQMLLQSGNLIGKTVSAVTKDADGKPLTISGKITKIAVKDGTIYATVDNNGTSKEVMLSSITEMS